MNFVGKEIKKYRKERGLSQKELGEKMSVSQAMIAQYENGTRLPKLTTMVKLSYALEIDAHILTDAYQLDVNSVCSEIRKNDSPTNEDIKKETKLLNDYRLLNDDGKDKAIEQIEMLTKIPEFKKMTHKEANEYFGIDFFKADDDKKEED